MNHIQAKVFYIYQIKTTRDWESGCRSGRVEKLRWRTLGLDIFRLGNNGDLIMVFLHPGWFMLIRNQEKDQENDQEKDQENDQEKDQEKDQDGLTL